MVHHASRKYSKTYITAVGIESLESETRANFPHYLRAVNGKHIPVIKPEHSGWIFYNYKDFSVVLMAVAEKNYSFVYVDIDN
jgi:hypothetical protein